MARFEWTGPFRIRDLLASCLDDAQAWPPASKGVYLVSRRRWTDAPSSECLPLYIGGNTGKSERFCTRIGDLIADMHGFWAGGTGHHSGGIKLYNWCAKNKVPPGNLYIGWARRVPWCGRCAEIELLDALCESWQCRQELGLLNGSRPPACAQHNRRLA